MSFGIIPTDIPAHGKALTFRDFACGDIPVGGRKQNSFLTFRDFVGLTPSDIPARLRRALHKATKKSGSSELVRTFW